MLFFFFSFLILSDMWSLPDSREGIFFSDGLSEMAFRIDNLLRRTYREFFF